MCWSRTGAVLGGILWVASAQWVPAQDGALAEDPLFERFASELYPLMARDDALGCVDCHDSESTSDLTLFGDVAADYLTLRDRGYLETQGPDTILGRLTASNPKRRMPKGRRATPWTEEEIDRVRRFVGELAHVREIQSGVPLDEQFPAALRLPYHGTEPDGLDYRFVGYQQLRGKVATIFDDAWVREGVDLFEKNVSLFRGADFKSRFNESREAASSFFVGLEMMARDVVSRAYLNRRGPFEEWPAALPLLSEGQPLASTTEDAIRRLYCALLFRDPRPEEMESSGELLRSIAAESAFLAETPDELAFELTVTDTETGFESRAGLRFPVSPQDGLGRQQRWVDQTESELEGPQRAMGGVALATAIPLGPEASNATVRLQNTGSVGNVSFAGLRLIREGTQEPVWIEADDSRVVARGAWKIRESGGFVSFEDEGQDKGASEIVVRLVDLETGRYTVELYWREDQDNARGVFVELAGPGPDQLALTPLVSELEPGRAVFHYDASDDTRTHYTIPGRYRFRVGDAIEVSNRATRGKVTIGGVTLVDEVGGSYFLDAADAEGADSWKPFNNTSFRAYNQKGTQLEDIKDDDGPSTLRFDPTGDALWDPEKFYEIRVHYPAKRGHARQVPVDVKASASTPLVRLRHPVAVGAGARARLDASPSGSTHKATLEFRWEQVNGAAASLDTTSPNPTFVVPPRRADDVAWMALARALMRHPDFLFSLPPSIVETEDVDTRRRLMLVRLAQELVGRVPNQSEWARFDQGASFDSMVQGYLETQDFRDDYFRRIRLYLESQGTESQDEPARIWSYVCFNGRPFQEILTGDYTVTSDFRAVPRPRFHGNTGLLTAKGFIEGKPGLPHYNYAAQVTMLFLGYVYEVPAEVVEQREGVTALGTTDPNSVCYSCHKVLTPLAFQRQFWTDAGQYRTHNEFGLPIDASDRGVVEEYPFRGQGMEAFASQAVRKERFIRTIINSHHTFYVGRPLRYREDERALYQRLWDRVHETQFDLRALIRAIVTSPEFLRPALEIGDTVNTASTP